MDAARPEMPASLMTFMRAAHTDADQQLHSDMRDHHGRGWVHGPVLHALR
jgi:hypothetical protein